VQLSKFKQLRESILFMVNVIEASTGEIHEDIDLAEAAAELIERPPYWRRIGYSAADIGTGEYGLTFRKAFFEAQKEIGPVIEADSLNEFNKSKFTSLGYLLGKVMPILQKHGLSVIYYPGRVNIRGDLNKLSFLPVLMEITHVESGEWRVIPLEMPVSKYDAQSIGSAATYARRYITEMVLGLKSGLDDDGVRASHDLTPEDKYKMLASMLKKIEECKTPLDLRTWYKASEQQVALLGDAEAEKLRTAYQDKLQATKDVIKKKSETKNA
jgi:hypothetical protein